MTTGTSPTIRVLHVDDEPDVLELTAAFLVRESDGFDLVGETRARDALDRLEDEPVDCIVSDYEMPGMNGQSFLEAVREGHPDLPFILFTGQGSEDVASAAITAGVTDYMQKQVGTSQYEVLANRIRNAVENFRTRTRYDRQRRAIETAREGIALLDADGCFTYVNQAYADLYGYAPDEMVGEHWELVYPDEEVDRAWDEILPAVERDGRWRGETLGLRADGTTFLEDHSLAGTADGGLVCIVREAPADASPEQIAAEPAQLLEHAADMINFVDPDGIIQYANRAATELTGYGRDELVGADVSLIMDERDVESARADLRELLSAGPDAGSTEFSWTLRSADGETILCDSNVRPVFVDGTWVGFVGVVRDVSDRIEREQLLERRNEEVERTNEQLSTLASVVSHDLRNPMNVAVGRLALAREECDSAHLADVEHSLDRAQEIIDGTLALVREWQTVEERTSIALASFARDCWGHVATGGACLEIEDDVVLHADDRRLRNLLENLFGNAIEHGGDGVTVRIGALEDGFYVADDGPGIPATDAERVFDAGYSTRREGTGLGLHIVRAIVEAHGWTIRTVPDRTGGARFEVTGVDLVPG